MDTKKLVVGQKVWMQSGNKRAEDTKPSLSHRPASGSTWDTSPRSVASVMFHVQGTGETWETAFADADRKAEIDPTQMEELRAKRAKAVAEARRVQQAVRLCMRSPSQQNQQRLLLSTFTLADRVFSLRILTELPNPGCISYSLFGAVAETICWPEPGLLVPNGSQKDYSVA